MSKIYDAIIIGAGPAGISCALELHDNKVDYIILEKTNYVAPALSKIRNKIVNFAGGLFQNGDDWRHKLEDLVEQTQLHLVRAAEISEVDLQKRTVYYGDHALVGRTVVLATGYRVRKLHLPGESMFVNDIFYSIGGAETELTGKRVAIIGGGDSALLNSLELTEKCAKVYLIHRSKFFKARPDVIDAIIRNPKIEIYLDTEIDSLIGSKNLTGIQVITRSNGQVLDIPVDKMLVKIGYNPNTELFRGQVAMDQSGHIKINGFCETSSRNVFALGDITSPGYPRIATATGHGVIAAGRIRSLVEETTTV